MLPSQPQPWGARGPGAAAARPCVLTRPRCPCPAPQAPAAQVAVCLQEGPQDQAGPAIRAKLGPLAAGRAVPPTTPISGCLGKVRDPESQWVLSRCVGQARFPLSASPGAQVRSPRPIDCLAHLHPPKMAGRSRGLGRVLWAEGWNRGLQEAGVWSEPPLRAQPVQRAPGSPGCCERLSAAATGAVPQGSAVTRAVLRGLCPPGVPGQVAAAELCFLLQHSWLAPSGRPGSRQPHSHACLGRGQRAQGV